MAVATTRAELSTEREIATATVIVIIRKQAHLIIKMGPSKQRPNKL
jgi:hypothetical protein